MWVHYHSSNLLGCILNRKGRNSLNNASITQSQAGEWRVRRDFFEGSLVSLGPDPLLFLSVLRSGWLLQLRVQHHSGAGSLALRKWIAFSHLRVLFEPRLRLRRLLGGWSFLVT